MYPPSIVRLAPVMNPSIRAKALSRAKVSCPLLEATLGVRA
jgi:hypothetical protein